MLGSDGRLYDEDFDFDGDGKLNAYEYSVMDDVVFGDHDEVDDDSEEEDDLEFDLAVAGLDMDELEDMDEDERREALEMIMIFRIAGGISEQAGKETRERFTRQYLQIYKRQR